MPKNINKKSENKKIGLISFLVFMSFIIITIIIAPRIVYALARSAEAPTVSISKTKVDSPLIVDQPKTYSINEAIERHSLEYGVSAKLVWAIMRCENYDFDPSLQSGLTYNFTNEKLGIYKGEREYSFGLSQINLHYNPNVSLEQAKDPEFSIEFMVRNLALNHHSWWACYSGGGYKKFLDGENPF